MGTNKFNEHKSLKDNDYFLFVFIGVPTCVHLCVFLIYIFICIDTLNLLSY